jgi:hypothetical protein
VTCAIAITEQAEMSREIQKRRVKLLVMESSLKRLLEQNRQLSRQRKS